MKKKGVSTVLVYVDKYEIDNEEKIEAPILKDLKLKMPKKVTWTEDTVDNEHMKKKKSKSNI